MANLPLNVLTIDGGGVRGLSALLILRTLMERLSIKSGSKAVTLPLPCEIFDVICGTSTGGLIAIMLGRLRMSVDDAIKHYGLFSKRVFGNPRSFSIIRKFFGSPMYDAWILEESMKEILDATGHDRDCFFEDLRAENPEDRCRTFVVAVSQDQVDAPPVLLRSYSTKTQQAEKCKLWEVVRATTATSGFFEPATISTSLQTFLDGTLKENNPSARACVELAEVFPSRPIGCFLSLGTGVQHIVGVRGNFIRIANACNNLATNCEATAGEVSKKFRMDSKDSDQPNPFFRFSVNRGLESIPLDDWNQDTKLAGITDAYMRFHTQSDKADKCAEVLTARVKQVRARKEPGESLL